MSTNQHAQAFVALVGEEALFRVNVLSKKLYAPSDWNDEAVRQGLRRTARRGRLTADDFESSVRAVVFEAKGRLAKRNRSAKRANARQEAQAAELSWATFPRDRGFDKDGENKHSRRLPDGLRDFMRGVPDNASPFVSELRPNASRDDRDDIEQEKALHRLEVRAALQRVAAIGRESGYATGAEIVEAALALTERSNDEREVVEADDSTDLHTRDRLIGLLHLLDQETGGAARARLQAQVDECKAALRSSRPRMELSWEDTARLCEAIFADHRGQRLAAAMRHAGGEN